MDKKKKTNFEIARRHMHADSSDIEDKLKNDAAPRYNPEKAAQRRIMGEKNFPKYEETLQFNLGFADDRDRAEIKNVATFHAMRRNDARMEDHVTQDHESVRQKADKHNITYKERAGSTDAYFRNRWNSNHNESLIPINYQDMALQETNKPVTDNSDFTPIQEDVKEIAKTYSPKAVKKHKHKA